MNRGTTIGGYRAEEYQSVQAQRSEPFSSKTLYHVVGMPGIWRRVTKPKVTDTASLGILQCYFDGSTIYLKHDEVTSREMIEGGYTAHTPSDFDAAVLKRLTTSEVVQKTVDDVTNDPDADQAGVHGEAAADSTPHDQGGQPPAASDEPEL